MRYLLLTLLLWPALGAQSQGFYPIAEIQEIIPSPLPLPAVGEVVINEFLAENENGSTDENGQKEDWVELYNRTASPKSLQGLSLTDDSGKPSKWDFPPGTMLPANGYLIVWMDEDSSQGPLHANFKLRKAGEFLMLSNGAGLVYDSLSFGAQTTDVSFGRYPNGTGAFTFMPTTFAAANSLVSAVATPATPERLAIFPNPATQTAQIKGSAPLGYLHLFDAGGRMVLHQQTLRAQQTQIDLTDLSPGVYWLRTAGGGGRLVVLRP